MEKYRINKLLFIIKNDLNENTFYLRTKFIIKIEIRDKKKFTKKFSWWGMGEGAGGLTGAIFYPHNQAI